MVNGRSPLAWGQDLVPYMSWSAMFHVSAVYVTLTLLDRPKFFLVLGIERDLGYIALGEGDTLSEAVEQVQ